MELLSLFIGFMFIFGWTWLAKTDDVDYVDDSHINLLQTRKVDTDGETPMVGTFQEDKGADVVAATNMTLGIDGNYYVITGNTAIVTIIHAQVQPGTIIRLKFSGIPIVTHSATDLILPGGANITMAAGNVMELVNIDTSKWRCTNILNADGAPLAHATSHENGGGDEIDVVGLSGLLADGQTPLAHKVSHQNGGGDKISVVALSGLLADDQHVLDAEVKLMANMLAGAPKITDEYKLLKPMLQDGLSVTISTTETLKLTQEEVIAMQAMISFWEFWLTQ